MKRFLQTSLILVALFLPGAVIVAQPAVVGASPFSNSQQEACSGIDLGDGSNSCAAQQNGGGVNSIIRTVLDILSLIVGAAAVIMVIIGGFRFVISGGDSNATSSARNTIIYALVGLFIAAVAQVLVHFVLSKTS